MKSIFLSVLLIVIFVLAGCGKKEKSTQPSFRPMVEAVYASGKIIPADEYKVFAFSEGYLTEKLVKEGDSVRKGQLLFRIESNEQNLRTANAMELYETARNNTAPALEELQKNLSNIRLKMLDDSVNFVRYRNLWQNNATAKIQYDRAELAYQSSKNEYQATQNRLQKLRNQLTADVVNARSQYLINREQQNKYAIQSLMDGIVFEVYKEQGEAVRRGDAIALVGDKKHFIMNLSVDELDINRLQLGQEVEAQMDVFGEKVFKGKVIKIYPMLNKADNSFRVDAEFDENPGNLYSGITVEANIIISKKEKTMTIPKDFIFGKDSVKIKEEGKTKNIKVRKGVENLEWVEILKGLDEKTVIVK
jgi:multidrug efflux pump subunit AcrA (membrane-fusion protein)